MFRRKELILFVGFCDTTMFLVHSLSSVINHERKTKGFNSPNNNLNVIQYQNGYIESLSNF